MKKIEYEDVSVAICFDDILHEALAESSYLAASTAALAQPEPRVSQLIITTDEMPLVHRACHEAYAAILPRLSAYAGEGSAATDEGVTFALRLPLERSESIDALLLHELRRAIVSYLLSRWFYGKSAQLAADALRRYEASVGLVFHDIRLTQAATRRPVNYF